MGLAILRILKNSSIIGEIVIVGLNLNLDLDLNLGTGRPSNSDKNSLYFKNINKINRESDKFI